MRVGLLDWRTLMEFAEERKFQLVHFCHLFRRQSVSLLFLNSLHLNLCDFGGASVVQPCSGGVVWWHRAVSGSLGAMIWELAALDLQVVPAVVLSLNEPVVVVSLRCSINMRKTLVLMTSLRLIHRGV